MTKYQHQAIINSSDLIKAGIEEETIIRQQIHQLIQQIPIEDLTRMIRVDREVFNDPYYPMERITTSIIL